MGLNTIYVAIPLPRLEGRVCMEKKTEIVMDYDYQYPDMDRMVVQILKVDDDKYANGIIYTFRYLKYDEEKEGYRTEFAIENSHGAPHIHSGSRKELAEFGWKDALAEFEKRVNEHRKKYRGDEYG